MSGFATYAASGKVVFGQETTREFLGDGLSGEAERSYQEVVVAIFLPNIGQKTAWNPSCQQGRDQKLQRADFDTVGKG